MFAPRHIGAAIVLTLVQNVNLGTGGQTRDLTASDGRFKSPPQPALDQAIGSLPNFESYDDKVSCSGGKVAGCRRSYSNSAIPKNLTGPPDRQMIA